MHDVCLYIVKRTQIYLDEEQDRRLAKRSKSRGTTKSQLIREAIDGYLDGELEGRPQRLARFRAALDGAAGSIPRLPAGSEYVEDLRKADRARERALEQRRRG